MLKLCSFTGISSRSFFDNYRNFCNDAFENIIVMLRVVHFVFLFFHSNVLR